MRWRLVCTGGAKANLSQAVIAVFDRRAVNDRDNVQPPVRVGLLLQVIDQTLKPRAPPTDVTVGVECTHEKNNHIHHRLSSGQPRMRQV